MYDNKFLFNYMYLRSKPKKFISKSKAASLALQSSVFATTPIGGFLSANNSFAKEKATQQKKEAEKLNKETEEQIQVIQDSIRTLARRGEEQVITQDILTRNDDDLSKLVLAKICFNSLEGITGVDSGIAGKIKNAGGLQKFSISEIIKLDR